MTWKTKLLLVESILSENVDNGSQKASTETMAYWNYSYLEWFQTYLTVNGHQCISKN